MTGVLSADAPATTAPVTIAPATTAPVTMAPVTMAGALNAALADSLAADERVLVFGEDVGTLGGVFRMTDGLAAASASIASSTCRSPSPASSALPSGWR